MATVDALLTAEQYQALPDNGQPTELVRGRIVPMNVPYPRHGQICAALVYLLRHYLEGDDRGHVVSNDAGVVTERNPDTVRGADIAFYSYARVPKGPFPRGYLAVAPEVAFEVLSPFDRLPPVLAKVVEYLDAGVLAVCILDEQTRTLTVYRHDQPPQVLSADQEFALPEFLSGFGVLVRQFFE